MRALVSHDEGGGLALYAAGDFQTAGGMAANRIARWDGSSWSALGSGLGDADGEGRIGRAFAVYDDGTGAKLCVGGNFSVADSGDSHLARWGCPPPDTTAPVITCSGDVERMDRFWNGLGEVVHFTVTAADDHDPAPSVQCVPPSGSTFPPGTTQVQCSATDASGNTSSCQFAVTVVPKARRR